MACRRMLLAVSLFALGVAAFPTGAISRSTAAGTPTVGSDLFREMRWRSIGPYRGGRTKAAAGVPTQPNVFYVGVCNGGVWKTTDFGRVWTPIFDEQPTGSIGDIAVAPSDPNIVYVASGEGLQRPDLSTGDGVYRSRDAGTSWVHLGLRGGQQIPRLAVDPRSPDRVFAAVLGHPYGPNDERGIYRSLDGGQTFERVLFKDENTGGSDVEIDPSAPDNVYACLWEGRQGPWENAAWSGTNGGIFKSADGGRTWRQLVRGLPPDGIVQADIAVSPSNPKRLYATVASPRAVGIYRSDDGGENWVRATTDARPAGRIGGGDLPVPCVNPLDQDTLLVASTVAWKSTDGGRTWAAFRGAPGGDDYQRAWINPHNPDIVLMAADQGAVITVNGGKSWSSWYNQPTAQLYHVAADNAFPYRVCSGQQESGSACVSSRGDHGQITFRDWQPVAVDEYGYVAPDPLNPDIVYGGRGPTRFDRRTGQVQSIAPKPLRSADFRTLRTAPVVFSPADPHILYFAGNTLWKTINGGQSWTRISPDLSRKTWEIPGSVGKYRDSEAARPAQRGVIYTIAPSPLEVGRIWAGTDDGLIHITTDGGLHWNDVTPPDLKAWAKISLMDAGHFDPQVAYAAVNTLRLDDLRPHIYRTRDSGKTWTHITDGIPDGATVNVVKEDPRRKGLLFAGTETQVYVSFDDGDHWQSLRQNMPASSVRDLMIKGDDLVVATHGRGFWILDDITPLRQLDETISTSDMVLFKPQVATRVRWNMNTDTPLPPDEPAGQNPPDGAILHYSLKADANGPVSIEILDATGKSVRKFSSDDPVEKVDLSTLAVPPYWIRPPQPLSAAAGMHRFVWDLHYQPLPGTGRSYPISAIYMNTAPAPNSPWVHPGTYTVKLAVGNTIRTQPLTVRMDPRVKTSAAGLLQQFTLSKQLYDGAMAAQEAVQQIRGLRAKLLPLVTRAGEGPAKAPLAEFEKSLAALDGGAPAAGGPGSFSGGFGGRGAGPAGPDNLATISGSLLQLMGQLQGADVAPTSQLLAAVATRNGDLDRLLRRWRQLSTEGLSTLNTQLTGAGLPAVQLDAPKP